MAWTAFQFMYSNLKNAAIYETIRKQQKQQLCKLRESLKKYKSISLDQIDTKDLVYYLGATKGEKLSVKTH